MAQAIVVDRSLPVLAQCTNVIVVAVDSTARAGSTALVVIGGNAVVVGTLGKRS